ncbi:hypothetical protein VTI28DRAFT_1077 [Corynascus sepedonium]
MPLPHPWLAGDGLLLGITGGRAVSPAARAPVTCNRGWCRDAQRASTLSARAARRASLPCACVLPSMLHPSHDSTSVEGTGLAATAKARLAAAAEAAADGCRAHHWRPQQVLCFLVLSHSCAIIVQPPLWQTRSSIAADMPAGLNGEALGGALAGSVTPPHALPPTAHQSSRPSKHGEHDPAIGSMPTLPWAHDSISAQSHQSDHS